MISRINYPSSASIMITVFFIMLAYQLCAFENDSLSPTSSSPDNVSTFSLINEYLKNNDFPSAIELMRQCVDFDPDNDTLTNQLAILLNNYSLALVSDGEKESFDRALPLSKEALKLNPSELFEKNYAVLIMQSIRTDIEHGGWDSAIRHYEYMVYDFNFTFLKKENTPFTSSGLANQYVLWGDALREANELSTAQDKYLKSLSCDPSCKPALFWLGYMAYLRHDLDEAYTYWSQLKELGESNQVFLEQYDTLLREMESANHLDTSSDTVFDIHFHDDIPLSLRSDIRSYLNKAHRTIGRKLSFLTQGRVSVVIVPSNEFSFISGQPHWSVGLFNGKIIIPIDYSPTKETADQLKETIFHEYTHFVLFNKSKHLPLWLHEGLAEFFSTDRKQDITSVKNALLSDTCLQLQSLNSIILENAEPHKVSLAYSEAYLVVKYIKETYNTEMIIKLIEEFDVTSDTDAVFSQLFDLSFNEFEQKWKSYILKTLLSRTEQKLIKHSQSSSQSQN